MKSQKNEIQSLKELKVQTKVYQEELENGLDLMDKVQKNQIMLVNEIAKELSHQSELKEKIIYLKKQYKLLQTTFTANNKILNGNIEERIELQTEVQRVEKLVTAIKTNQKTKASVISNNYPLLIQRINEGNAFPKEKSVLLSVIKELIGTTNANEFSDFQWKAKVAKSKGAIGARICFSKLAILKSDMKDLYGPVIKELGIKFNRSNIVIETKTKKLNGVVTELDITIKVPFKIIEKRLELP